MNMTSAPPDGNDWDSTWIPDNMGLRGVRMEFIQQLKELVWVIIDETIVSQRWRVDLAGFDSRYICGSFRRRSGNLCPLHTSKVRTILQVLIDNKSSYTSLPHYYIR